MKKVQQRFTYTGFYFYFLLFVFTLLRFYDEEGVLYRVTYEDGDTEDLDEGELQEIALPVATESAQTPSKGGRNGSSTAPAAPVQVSGSC